MNILALTGTATHATLDIVTKQLSLEKPVIVAISPDRQNIKLVMKPSQPLDEFAMQLTEDLRASKEKYPKTIVFCKSYNDCCNLYAAMVRCLGKEKTLPPGYPANLLEYRMLTMYTRASTDVMKKEIISSYAQETTTLRIIVATAAFSMVMDIPHIQQIFHWCSPSTVEQYIQEIGRAGAIHNYI